MFACDVEGRHEEAWLARKLGILHHNYGTFTTIAWSATSGGYRSVEIMHNDAIYGREERRESAFVRYVF